MGPASSRPHLYPLPAPHMPPRATLFID